MNNRLWEKCAEAHGHECGGLTIGFKAALYIVEIMGLKQDEDGCVCGDEELICVAENQACSVDAIRVVLGCTEKRGNLIFNLTGEQAYTVCNRRTREAVRIVLCDRPEGITREQSFAYYQSREPREMFERQTVHFTMPEIAGKSETYTCSVCGESAAANWFRFVDGKPLCLDCFAEREE